MQPMPRSRLWATDIEVLPLDRVITRHGDHLVVRSPGNPEHFFGNLLIFDEPPEPGCRARWERLFDDAFADEPRIEHRAFGWDRTDGALGAATSEFARHGYTLDATVGLVAAPAQIVTHPRANAHVRVHPLDSAPGAQDVLWEQVLELQVAARNPRFSEDEYRPYAIRRMADVRSLLDRGRGAWFVALEPEGDTVVGSCGVIVTGTRARFQSVDTAPAHRRRGVCSRLVVEAAHWAGAHLGASDVVIGADPDYHALGIYESLGFVACERVSAVHRWPRNAARS